MSLEKKIAERKKRRALRVRKQFKHMNLPRVTVFRSAKHIYGQVIDDAMSKTVVSFSTVQMEDTVAGDKKAVAHQVGLGLAKKALEKGIKKVSFDRGSFLYHGRVKAFADGLREGGIAI